MDLIIKEIYKKTLFKWHKYNINDILIRIVGLNEDIGSNELVVFCYNNSKYTAKELRKTLATVHIDVFEYLDYLKDKNNPCNKLSKYLEE